MSTRCMTYSGQGFDPLNPRQEDVHIEDIAHHLALRNRFGGATPEPYSVAEHAVRVARIVLSRTADPLAGLYALHHDNGEAYLGDIPRPWKEKVWVANTPFEVCESQILDVILQALSIGRVDEIPDSVWEADNDLLRVEKREMFGDDMERLAAAFVPMSWRAAKSCFLSMHDELIYQIKGGKP